MRTPMQIPDTAPGEPRRRAILEAYSPRLAASWARHSEGRVAVPILIDRPDPRWAAEARGEEHGIPPEIELLVVPQDAAVVFARAAEAGDETIADVEAPIESGSLRVIVAADGGLLVATLALPELIHAEEAP